MTTKVIIECQEGSQNKVSVTLVHATTKEPYGYVDFMSPGQKREFHVWSNQSLLIEEIKNVNLEKTEE